jgi:hypothetical protein
MGHTQELEYASLSTATLVTLRRIFAQWPRGTGVARARLTVVERELVARGVDLGADVPQQRQPTH